MMDAETLRALTLGVVVISLPITVYAASHIASLLDLELDAGASARLLLLLPDTYAVVGQGLTGGLHAEALSSTALLWRVTSLMVTDGVDSARGEQAVSSLSVVQCLLFVPAGMVRARQGNLLGSLAAGGDVLVVGNVSAELFAFQVIPGVMMDAETLRALTLGVVVISLPITVYAASHIASLLDLELDAGASARLLLLLPDTYAVVGQGLTGGLHAEALSSTALLWRVTSLMVTDGVDSARGEQAVSSLLGVQCLRLVPAGVVSPQEGSC